MRKVLLLLSLFIIAVSCSSENKGGDDSQKLVLALEKGSTYTLDQKSEISIKQQISGQNIDIDMGIAGDMSFEVTDVTDSIYTMSTTYTRFVMTMSNAMMNMSVDTDAEQEPEEDFNKLLSSLLKSMVNKPFTVKISNTGTIKSVDGLEAIYQGMMSELSAKYPDMSPQTLNSVFSQMQQAYGEDAFKGSFEMYMNLYPEGEVAVNDTWNKQIELRAGMEGAYDVTYTYTGESNGNQQITASGKMQTANKDAYTKINGMDARYDLTGDFDGTFEVDTKTGWIRKADIKQTAAGEISVKPNEQMPEGMTIPMEMTSKTTLN